MELQEMNQRINDLLGELTLLEKVKMIHGDALFYSGGVERLHIPSIQMSDGPMGVRQEFPRDSWIPVGNSDDYVSYCLSNSAIAATWNRDIAYHAGQVMGEEARGRGKDILLGPGINIKRIPANGRNFEYMSEDPCLIAELVVPLIQGIQESDVAACVKHFALNNQETDRLWVNVEIDERALREIYLPGFEAAVQKGKSLSVMGAYNLFRGVHCCENQELLGKILRQEWGYDGAVISDWGAIQHTNAAAKSPIDLEMSVTYDFDAYKLAQPLLDAVARGEVSEADIDEKVRHLLLLMFRLRMLDAAENAKRKSGCYNTSKHREAIRSAAEEAVVLLKNEENRLPLKPKEIKELLVIGDNAERLHAQGGGSAEIKALYEISPLMGLKSQLGGNTKITYARGYYVAEKKEEEASWQETSTEDSFGTESMPAARKTVSAEVREKQEKLRTEAVALARQTKDVLLFVGLNHDYDVEGYDRDSMELPYEQDTLIREVLAVNPDAIIVVMAGNAVSMGGWKDQAKAIIWEYYCGMEHGNVITDVLFGTVNPSGKLPESMPYCMEDCGALALGEYPGRPLTEAEAARMDARSTMEYRDGIYVGYRYYEKYGVPVQFCFGHGLSYTTYAYTDVRVQAAGGDCGALDAEAAVVQLLVTNTGACAGKETVQIYVGKKDSQIDRPVKELRGFEKLALAPGESREVTIQLTNRAFAYYDEEQAAFVVEPGSYEIYVGKSLQQIECVETLTIG